ncbi:hypothetical protein JCM8547_001421 [Rhodosporidiobolus lusitaniae]
MSNTTTAEGSPPERFDKIRFADLSPEDEWIRLGKGSFGSVYKAEYLGCEVAVKEVLPSTEYDVEKYLQREITLMQQARHPNIVQYLGLCLAPSPPSPDGTPVSPRILIISEFLPRGNLRQYILDRTLPFPWRLRLSFAVDIARALAYLHARNCMHRDLKGENLLVTSNERLKACDFGLARVAPGGGKEDEAWRRLTYCGTDGYMSPEILLGQPFTLSTDIFSFGVLLLEIASRSLASNHTFVRQLPDYGISAQEAWSSVSSLCPRKLVELALECCDTNPEKRPETKEILHRLREIEREVLEADAAAGGADEEAHSRGPSIKRRASLAGNVGSISYAGTTKRGSYGALASQRNGGRGTARPSAPRLPSFEGQVNLKFGSSFISAASSAAPQHGHGHPRRHSPDSSEDDEEALLALADAPLSVDGADSSGELANLDLTDLDMRPDSAFFDRYRRGNSNDPEEDYSTSVVKPSSHAASGRSTILPSPAVDGQGRPYGKLGSSSGSHFSVPLGGAGNGGSLPSLPPSWVAAASREPSDGDDGTLTVIASPTTSAESTPARQARREREDAEVVSYLTARTETLSVASAVVGVHGLEPSTTSTARTVENVPVEGDEVDEEEESRDVFHSTLQSPVRVRVAVVNEDEELEADEYDVEVVEAPHRFSLIKPGLHRLFASLTTSTSAPAQLSSYSAGLGQSSSDKRLSFQLLGSKTGTESGVIDAAAKKDDKDGGRCGFCEKKFGGWKAHLVCDDCGFACHIKCSDSVPPTCPAFITTPSFTPSRSPAPTTTPSPSLPTSPTTAAPPKPTRAPPPAPAPLGKVDSNALAGRGAGGDKGKERPSKLLKKHRPASSIASQGSAGSTKA